MTAFSPEQEARLIELIDMALTRVKHRERARQVLSAELAVSPVNLVLAWVIAISADDAGRGEQLARAHEHLVGFGYGEAARRAILLALWPGELEAVARAMGQSRESYLDAQKMTGAERRTRLSLPPRAPPPVSEADVLEALTSPAARARSPG